MTRLGGLETRLLPNLFDESQGFFTMHTTIHSSVQHLAFEQLGCTVIHQLFAHNPTEVGFELTNPILHQASSSKTLHRVGCFTPQTIVPFLSSIMILPTATPFAYPPTACSYTGILSKGNFSITQPLYNVPASVQARGCMHQI